MCAAAEFLNMPLVGSPERADHRPPPCRVDFDPRPVSPPALEALGRVADGCPAPVRFVTDEAERAAVAALVAEGDRLLFADPSYRFELMSWWRRQASSAGTQADAFLPVPDLFPGLGSFYLSSFDLGDLQARRDFRLAARAPLLLVVHADETEGGRAAALESAQRLSAEAERLALTAFFFNQPVLVPDLAARLSNRLRLPDPPRALLAVGLPGVVPAD